MNNLMQSLLNFLFTDVKDKKETKDLAVLIRCISFIFGIYYLILGITLCFFQHYFMALILIAAIAGLCGAFIFTYESKTIPGLLTLNAVILIFSILLAFFIGYDLDFHIAILLNILLIYFNKSENMVLKRFYTIFLCIILMLLAQFCDAIGAPGLHAGMQTTIVRMINILICIASLGIIAYFYCNKFNQAEEKLRRINENLERMANLDTLTGLSNRRHMNEYLTGLVYEYNRSGKGFTLAIGDVDFFKKVNDTYGHDTGDYVLTTLSKMFEDHMKGKGHVARWGGEEFLFAFENMPIDKAYEHLDKLRQKIEGTPMHFKEYDFKVTMSYGMEEFNDRLGVEATINRADEHLYKAKTSGRNQVVIK